jgi:polyisoprenoid-binding protein YceI
MSPTLHTLTVLALGLLPLTGFAELTTYKIDAAHSYVLVKLNHLGIGNSWGRFNDISGSVVHDPVDPAKSAVKIDIKAESIDTANAKRDQHLRSPDFLNAKEFPVLSFVSKQIKKVDDKNYEITGDITVRGVTKTITVPAKITGQGKGPQGEERAGAEIAFKLKRSDFGINYMPGALGEEAEVRLDIEGVKQ